MCDETEQAYLTLSDIQKEVLGRRSEDLEGAVDGLADQEDLIGKIRLCLMDAQRDIRFLIRQPQMPKKYRKLGAELLLSYGQFWCMTLGRDMVQAAARCSSGGRQSPATRRDSVPHRGVRRPSRERESVVRSWRPPRRVGRPARGRWYASRRSGSGGFCGARWRRSTRWGGAPVPPVLGREGVTGQPGRAVLLPLRGGLRILGPVAREAARAGTHGVLTGGGHPQGLEIPRGFARQRRRRGPRAHGPSGGTRGAGEPSPGRPAPGPTRTLGRHRPRPGADGDPLLGAVGCDANDDPPTPPWVVALAPRGVQAISPPEAYCLPFRPRHAPSSFSRPKAAGESPWAPSPTSTSKASPRSPLARPWQYRQGRAAATRALAPHVRRRQCGVELHPRPRAVPPLRAPGPRLAPPW